MSEMNMESIGDPRSTIDKEIADFDAESETAFAEPAIRELIRTYPNNQDRRHVVVKVVATGRVNMPCSTTLASIGRTVERFHFSRHNSSGDINTSK
jgi:hypothetical protein